MHRYLYYFITALSLITALAIYSPPTIITTNQQNSDTMSIAKLTVDITVSLLCHSARGTLSSETNN